MYGKGKHMTLTDKSSKKDTNLQSLISRRFKDDQSSVVLGRTDAQINGREQDVQIPGHMVNRFYQRL